MSMLRTLLLASFVVAACGCGGTRVMPQLVRMPQPELPLHNGYKWEFKVQVEVCVAPDGSVLRAARHFEPDDLTLQTVTSESDVVRADLRQRAEVDSIAVATALAGTFTPAHEDGQPVEDCMVASVVFNRGKKLTWPELVSMDPPEYPQNSFEAENEGIVLVRCLVIGKTGLVKDAYVIQSVSPGIDEAALTAVRSAVFESGSVERRPVDIWTIIPIEFNIFGR